MTSSPLLVLGKLLEHKYHLPNQSASRHRARVVNGKCTKIKCVSLRLVDTVPEWLTVVPRREKRLWQLARRWSLRILSVSVSFVLCLNVM